MGNKENTPIYGNALYVYGASHGMTTGMVCSSIPGLALANGITGQLKHKKTLAAHPIERFLPECKGEWAMYTEMCQANPNCNDKAPPPYPYTEELLASYRDQVTEWYAQGKQ